MRSYVNGALVDLSGGRVKDECDYCGDAGHSYHHHPEAVQDVRVWARSQQGEEASWAPLPQSPAEETSYDCQSCPAPIAWPAKRCRRCRVSANGPSGLSSEEDA